MEWYYAANGQEIGPVKETQLAELHQAGVIDNNTLVWHPGLPVWGSYQKTINRARPAAPKENTSAIPEAVCAECGDIFAKEKTFAYGDVRVCIACKPAFLRKGKKAATVNPFELEAASFGRRLGAFLIDAAILFVIDCIMSLVIAVVMGLMGSRVLFEMDHPVASNLITLAVFLGVAVLYETFMVRSSGGTVGKLLTRTEVVTWEDKPVTLSTALLRGLSKYLALTFCSLGFLIVFFCRGKKSFQDLLCHTRVVVKP